MRFTKLSSNAFHATRYPFPNLVCHHCIELILQLGSVRRGLQVEQQIDDRLLC